jgi:rubredoxin
MQVAYFCANGHITKPSFATSDIEEIPSEWDCPRCGFPAGLDKDNPPEPMRSEPYKTHLAYVKERRTEADGQALLDEALESLRARRAGAETAP